MQLHTDWVCHHALIITGRITTFRPVVYYIVVHLHCSVRYKIFVNHIPTTVLSIADNGPCISSGHANTLFDESVVSNEKHELGLHLIRDLAKAIQLKVAQFS